MRMLRHSLPILLTLLLLPTAAATAGPSKEFKTDGFSWALPDGWVFAEVSPENKKFGIVARADCENASIRAFVFVQQSDLGVDGRVQDIRDQGAEGLGRLTKQAVKKTTLSGVKGKVVIKRIKPDQGGEAHLRTYVIHANGTFYQLIVRAFHGAHKTQTDGLNAVRKGFRLLQGAGGEDADETFDEVDGGDGEAADGDTGSDAPGGWPAKGPKLEGRTVHLPERNLRWTLPEGPVRWVGAHQNVTDKNGRWMWAQGNVKRKKGEFEKDTPDANRLILDVLIQPVPDGLKAVDWVKQGGLQNNVVKGWKLLAEVMAGKTVLRDETKIGNHTGAWGKFEGKQGGAHRVVMVFTTVLRGDWYVFRAIGDGHTDVYKHLAPVVGKALRGIEFIETKEAQRGPLAIASVPDFASTRGEDGGKEKTYTLPGIKFEKPEAMTHVPAGGSMEPELRWAGEARSEDGEAYLYFDISHWQLNRPNTPNPKEEDIIEKRIEQWKAGGGDTAQMSKRGKPPFYKKGNFGRAKGLKYEFRGDLDGVPFVEEGYLVKWKQNLLRFRLQYGGKDAEKKLKTLLKEVKKGVDFQK